ncbi:hypothetical protein [Amycolatopsis sp. cmx-11-51]|uniref:hypothetical protein n=1 Tax=Amycolatopsis sp. cmx-11-51 TaxID=2785797 RepID=UPI0039E54C4B
MPVLTIADSKRGLIVPHDKRFDISVNGHQITGVTASLNVIAVPEDRLHLSGAESGIAIELAAIQHLLELVADGSVTAEQVRKRLHDLGSQLHESNRELRAMKEIDELTWAGTD